MHGLHPEAVSPALSRVNETMCFFRHFTHFTLAGVVTVAGVADNAQHALKLREIVFIVNTSSATKAHQI